ncbi:putative bifunctional diguanylate cyclase/phosphodiesterase [Litchfieldella rifensis]|uniref:Bifunctional diguanylate cyclase/phosphodiesterase n=1 Tax=Litchfieldella rifensis TaxID=762643 RepID=A0ABV7LL93_9GAMM
MAALSIGAIFKEQRLSDLQAWPAPLRHGICIGALATLLALGTLTVYLTGGTTYAYPYLMLIPVLLAAAWYRLTGALVASSIAGLLMAAMPLEVATGAVQTPANWLVRLGLYLVVGGFGGWLFHRLRQSTEAREAITRCDLRSGLLNALALEEDLAKSLVEPRRRGKSVGLMLVRITDITEILEAMGADASDELVVAISERLAREVPDAVGVYRFGDAELVLLLKGVDKDDIECIAQRLAEVGEDNLLVQDVPMRAQLVLGSSMSQGEGLRPDDLIREARIAMFAAVERHHTHCHYAPAFKRRTVQTVKLISRVRRGLELGEFELHYQPKIRLSDGRVCGCEGLLRWRDEHGAVIAPGLFMPKVENTTLIAPVTRFVAGEACRFAAASEGVVGINFSVRNLFDEDLLRVLEALVEHSGFAPRRLEVEITESALMQDLGAAKRAIERIRDFGIGVSIDDFGTGFASFEYLRHLPITGLKIDRAFISGLEQDQRACKLMGCMIDVGHALDLVVTAEGVETPGEADILRELGCDQAQGFLYSAALPGHQYLEWCRAYAERRDLSV